MPSGGSLFQRQMGYYLPPGAPELKLACARQHGTKHGRFERSDLGMEGLEKRLDAMHEWLEHPPRPGDPIGCDFCRDDENRLYGFMTPVACNDDAQMLLIRCPRCGTLYEKATFEPDETRPLTDDEARARFPDAFPPAKTREP